MPPFAAFAEAAAERGMQTTLEFAKSLALSDLDSAVDWPPVNR
jgi:hypothetical protein